ncbi:MAG: hypothetical protein LBU65_04455 [Planctomycetaceae bacterium]|jgi:hypothetical protein|nr:hypothetical protein [Planctomycetaceae bacterium]
MKSIITVTIITLCFIALPVIVFGQRDIAKPADKTQPQPVNPNAEIKPTVPKKRQREGTSFQSQDVVFRQIGTRTSAFFQPGNERYTCLENQCLDRAMKVVNDTQEQTYWKIDGEFTEFQGENFLIIKRAVLSP